MRRAASVIDEYATSDLLAVKVHQPPPPHAKTQHRCGHNKKGTKLPLRFDAGYI